MVLQPTIHQPFSPAVTTRSTIVTKVFAYVIFQRESHSESIR